MFLIDGHTDTLQLTPFYPYPIFPSPSLFKSGQFMTTVDPNLPVGPGSRSLPSSRVLVGPLRLVHPTIGVRSTDTAWSWSTRTVQHDDDHLPYVLLPDTS